MRPTRLELANRPLPESQVQDGTAGTDQALPLDRLLSLDFGWLIRSQEMALVAWRAVLSEPQQPWREGRRNPVENESWWVELTSVARGEKTCSGVTYCCY